MVMLTLTDGDPLGWDGVIVVVSGDVEFGLGDGDSLGKREVLAGVVEL